MNKIQPKNWRKVKLGKIMEFSNGDISTKREDGGVFPVYGANGIIGCTNDINTDEDSIVIGRVGAYCGNVFFIKSKSWVTDNAIVARVKNNVSPFFMAILLRRLRLNFRAGGSGQPLLNQGILKEIEVILPDYRTQKRIANTLFIFDDKIELNNKINQNLEQTAQTIFKEWFVKKEKLGGWETKKITKIIKKLIVGKKYDNKTVLPKGKIPVLDQGQSGFIGYHNNEPEVRASVDNPVIIFTNHTCNYRLMTRDFSCIQNVLPYIGDKGYSTLFIYFLTKDKIKMQEYKGHWPEFEEQIFIIPPPILAQNFTDYIKPMIKKMVGIENENQKLASLRDLLLPKLMSGEIRA